MTSTRTIVKSIRVTPELWAVLERYAEADKMTPNAVVVRFLEENLLEVEPAFVPLPKSTQKRLNAELGRTTPQRPVVGYDAVTGEPIYQRLPYQKPDKRKAP